MKHPPKKNKTLLKTAFAPPIPAPILGQDQISYAWPSLSRYIPCLSPYYWLELYRSIPMTPSSSLGHTSSWASGEVGASCSSGSPSKQLMAGETQPEKKGRSTKTGWVTLLINSCYAATNLLVRCDQKSEDPYIFGLALFFHKPSWHLWGQPLIIHLMTPFFSPYETEVSPLKTMSPLMNLPIHSKKWTTFDGFLPSAKLT